MVFNNMEQSNPLIDPQDEVKKLQDLVKKLEKQNELLRSKQKLQTIDSHLPNGEDAKPVSKNTDNVKHKLQNDSLKGLDDVEIVNIDELSIREEEESWLYSSPKAPTPQQTKVSPYKWVRQEFDYPSPELESGRKSLLSKMDEVARNLQWVNQVNRSCSTPSLGNHHPSSNSSLSRSAENSSPYSIHPSSRKSLLASIGGNRVDTGTFTRPRKKQSGEKLRYNNGEKENDYSNNERLPECTDIEAVAKLQEESLRQSITHHPSPRRGMNRKGFGFIASDTDNSGSPVGSTRSSPGRFDDSGTLERYRNSIDSDGSSPPDSPQTQQDPYNYNTYTKRGLSKANRLHQYSSDSSLDHQSVGSDEANLAPETRPVKRLQPTIRSQSPGFGLKQPTPVRRGASPGRSGLPQPMSRRSIPRPSTGRSSLPSPRRSNIPSPRPNNNHSAESEDNWRDGCF